MRAVAAKIAANPAATDRSNALWAKTLLQVAAEAEHTRPAARANRPELLRTTLMHFPPAA